MRCTLKLTKHGQMTVSFWNWRTTVVLTIKVVVTQNLFTKTVAIYFFFFKIKTDFRQCDLNCQISYNFNSSQTIRTLLLENKVS